MNFNQAFEECGVEVNHFFSSGAYAKETIIPKGVKLLQHVHSFDHMSILAKGKVLFEGEEVSAPKVLTIKAGKAHSVTALEDSVWYCIHATEETDWQKIDGTLV